MIFRLPVAVFINKGSLKISRVGNLLAHAM